MLPLIADLPSRIGGVRTAIAAGRADAGIDPLVADTNAALEALRELSRGVFPSQLARAGLVPALRSMLARSGGAPTLTVDGLAGRRFSPRVEAAVYFCCVEATGSGRTASALRLELDGPRSPAAHRRTSTRTASTSQTITDRVEAPSAGTRRVRRPGPARCRCPRHPWSEVVLGVEPRG